MSVADRPNHIEWQRTTGVTGAVGRRCAEMILLLLGLFILILFLILILILLLIFLPLL